jgi:hypothetical protein
MLQVDDIHQIYWEESGLGFVGVCECAISA